MFEFLILVNLLLPYISGKRYISSLLIVLTVIIIIIENKEQINRNIRILAIFTIAELVNNYVSIIISGTDYTFADLAAISITILIPVFSYFCAYKLVNKKRYKQKNIEFILVAISVMESLIGILQILFLPFRMLTLQLYSSVEKYTHTFAGEFVRVVGTFGNPNNYACFIAILFCVNLNYIIKSKGKHYLFSIYAIITTIAIIFSQSKTAIIIFIVLIIYTIFDFKNIKRLFLFTIFVGIAIIILLKVSNIGGIFLDYLDVSDNLTLGGRKDIWIKYYDVFKNEGIINIIFGNGPNFFKSIDTSIDSAYLNALVAGGFTGLLIFIFKYMLLLSFSKSKNYNKEINIILLGIIILNITSQLDIISSIAYYLVLGAIDAKKNINSKKSILIHEKGYDPVMK